MAVFTPMSEQFAVSAQLTPEDVSAAADAGFKHLVCNRPDDEEPGQPDFANISASAAKLGMSVHHIPFDGATLNGSVIDAMEHTLSTLDGPVLAYCRSGTRCSLAWSVLRVRAGDDIDDVQSTTRDAGYDLGPQRALILALSG